MNGWQQVITGVKFNRQAVMQRATSRYTSNFTNTAAQRMKDQSIFWRCQVCAPYGIRTWFATTNVPAVSHYSMAPHEETCFHTAYEQIFYQPLTPFLLSLRRCFEILWDCLYVSKIQSLLKKANAMFQCELDNIIYIYVTHHVKSRLLSPKIKICFILS